MAACLVALRNDQVDAPFARSDSVLGRANQGDRHFAEALCPFHHVGPTTNTGGKQIDVRSQHRLYLGVKQLVGPYLGGEESLLCRLGYLVLLGEIGDKFLLLLREVGLDLRPVGLIFHAPGQ